MTNYDILKEYEAHGVELPEYQVWQSTLNTSMQMTAKVETLTELLKEVQSKIRYSSPTGIETFADLDDTLLRKINEVLDER